MSKKSSVSVSATLAIAVLVTAALTKELQANNKSTPDTTEADKIARRLLLQQQSLVNKLELEQLDLETSVATITENLLTGAGGPSSNEDLLQSQLRLEMHKVKLTHAKATLEEWSAPAEG